MVVVQQPEFCCEWNLGIYQVDLPYAIEAASRLPPGHPQKPGRLGLVQSLVAQGADASKEMALQGVRKTPMQRAQELGDAQTLEVLRGAVAAFRGAAPIVVCRDIDAMRDDEAAVMLPVAILFPGQGSQYVGMLREAQHLPPCRKLIDQARELLGYDLLDLCLNGPESKLEETKYCQPAMFLAGCCALEKLRMEKPEVVSRARATAGLSLGEYCALWFSGVINFQDCLRIVRVRADAMQEESRKCPQSMLSVAGLDQAVLEELCAEAGTRAGRTEDGRDRFCQIANHLFPKGYSCSGDTAAIEQLEILAQEAGALQAKRLKTSGAFHTRLMEPASTKVFKSLRAKVVDMNFPKMDLYMNVRGAAQRKGTDPRELNYDLSAQVSSPVLWRQSVEEMIRDGITEFYECGPMKQLKAMMKRIDVDSWNRTTNIDV